uniref:Tc1-like transposase DDE domain-containing protein n=1 Tax=Phytophthora ramorum TaxID=164328 RepID=H3G5W5_PHYRM
SIVVLDNANIHMYKELQEMIHETGALLFFLPPYSPDLNPIEVGFSLLKR